MTLSSDKILVCTVRQVLNCELEEVCVVYYRVCPTALRHGATHSGVESLLTFEPATSSL
jgi:hypothetical protein